MESARVIKSFDVIEEKCIGFCPCSWDTGMKAFGFESGPERFHSGIIVAVGAPAHTLGYAI